MQSLGFKKDSPLITLVKSFNLPEKKGGQISEIKGAYTSSVDNERAYYPFFSFEEQR